MLKGALVLIWELDMNLELTLLCKQFLCIFISFFIFFVYSFRCSERIFGIT